MRSLSDSIGARQGGRVHLATAPALAVHLATARPPVLRGRYGFSLVVAMVSLAVTGSLIAGLFFLSTQEYRGGRNRLLQTRALTAAEYGQNATVTASRWSSEAWQTRLADGDVAVQSFQPGDGSTDTVRITRLSARSFLVVSDGHAGRGPEVEASRRVATLVQLVIPQMLVPAAITARGSVELTGPALVSGADDPVPGWDCPASSGGKAGIAVADASRFDAGRWCESGDCVSGVPPVDESPAATDTATHFAFGDVDWADLTTAAKRVGPGTLPRVAPAQAGDGSCDLRDPRNWGDPRRRPATPGSCEHYFPVIYSAGDLTLGGGTGQGILLVDGDLRVQGAFEFFGPVIVRGDLEVTGPGAHVSGGVLAANVRLGADNSSGTARITYSGCAIGHALVGSATPRVAEGRAWVELFR